MSGAALGGEGAALVCLAASLTALAMGGDPDGVVAALALVPCAFASVLRPRARQGFLDVGLAVTGVAIAWAVTAGMVLQQGVGMGLVALALHQWLQPDRRGARRTVLMVTALLMVAAATRTRSVGFLPVWGVWALGWLAAGASPGLPRRALLGVVGGTFLLAMGLFVALPRPAAPAGDDPVTGLSEEVALGDFEALHDDRALVATVRFVDGRARPVLMRAAALDAFDGVRWRRTAPLRATPALGEGEGEHVVVTHLDFDGAVLVPGEVIRVLAGDLRQDRALAWRVQPGRGEVRFEAEVRIDGALQEPVLPPEVRRGALELPEGLDPRIPDLARRVVDGAADDAARAAAIESHVASNHRYVRTGVLGGPDPLATFLFDTKAGHCEYFASAVVVLARAAGLPARVVTGFAGGQVDGDVLRVTAADAHAWAELHVAGEGWRRVDATASGGSTPSQPIAAARAPSPEASSWSWTWGRRIQSTWEDRVLAFDRQDQVAWSRPLRTPLAFGTAAALCLAGAWLIARRGRRSVQTGSMTRAPARGQVALAWDRAVQAVAVHGLVAPADLPPVAQGDWLAERVEGAGAWIRRLAWLHAEVRFGGEDDASRAHEATALSEAVARALGHEEAGSASGPIPADAPRRPPARS